jgi:hypothetical protein
VRQRAGERDAPSDASARRPPSHTQRLGRAQELAQLASAQEMPPPRVRRSAAALAVVRFNEHLVSEHLGERRDQRDTTRRPRYGGFAARGTRREVTIVDGIAITSHLSRAASAACAYAAALARGIGLGGTSTASAPVAADYTPAPLDAGACGEVVPAPRVRVGLTATGPTSMAPAGVTVELVALPLTCGSALSARACSSYRSE